MHVHCYFSCPLMASPCVAAVLPQSLDPHLAVGWNRMLICISKDSKNLHQVLCKLRNPGHTGIIVADLFTQGSRIWVTPINPS